MAIIASPIVRMAVTTGKRKREITKERPHKAIRIQASDSSDVEDNARLKAIFAKHFEAQFKPLPEKKVQKQVEAEDLSEDVEESDSEDWEGFPEEGDALVQVVELSEAQSEGDSIASKRELKAFLSGKVPKSTTVSSAKTPTRDVEDDEDASAEKLNLKNDLALQRLLKESHLLDTSNSSTDQLEASGKNRLRALDIRMQSLGAKTSSFDGGKMPMLMRKGVDAHRAGLASKRRKDAVENGIILEKEKREKKFKGRRETGIGGPILGKYKGGMLTLSKKDVRSIEGPKDVRRKGGKRKGRR